MGPCARSFQAVEDALCWRIGSAFIRMSLSCLRQRFLGRTRESSICSAVYPCIGIFNFSFPSKSSGVIRIFWKTRFCGTITVDEYAVLVCQRVGAPPMWTMSFGHRWVSSEMRVPRPLARIKAFKTPPSPKT